jgi:hypothetical protein
MRVRAGVSEMLENVRIAFLWRSTGNSTTTKTNPIFILNLKTIIIDSSLLTNISNVIKIHTFNFKYDTLTTKWAHTSASLELPLHSLQAPDWNFWFGFPGVPSFELVPVPENCFLQIFRATPLFTWLHPLLAGDKNCTSENRSRHR